VLSVIVLALLTTWMFSLAVLTMIYVHEHGHLWATRRYGFKTKGIFFIPLLGGVALADGHAQTQEQEVVIALMGPIWGLGVSILYALVYYFTHNELVAALGLVLASINLFNLLPVYPMDGGRVAKAIMLSIAPRRGLLLTGIILILFSVPLLGISIYIGIFIGVIGLVSLWGESLHKGDILDSIQGEEFRLRRIKRETEMMREFLSPDQRECFEAHYQEVNTHSEESLKTLRAKITAPLTLSGWGVLAGLNSFTFFGLILVMKYTLGAPGTQVAIEFLMGQ